MKSCENYAGKSPQVPLFATRTIGRVKDVKCNVLFNDGSVSMGFNERIRVASRKLPPFRDDVATPKPFILLCVLKQE